MYCPKCGSKLKDGAKFCNKCGAKVGETQPKQEKVPVQEPKKPVGAIETVSKEAASKAEATKEAAAAKALPPKKKSPVLFILLLVFLLIIVLGAGGSILYYINTNNEAESLKTARTDGNEDEPETSKNRKKDKEDEEEKKKEEEEKAIETTKEPEDKDSSKKAAPVTTTAAIESSEIPETTAMQKIEPVSAVVQYAGQTSLDGLVKAGVLINTAYDSSHVVQEDTTIDNSGRSAFDGDSITSWQEGVLGDGIGEYVGISFDREYQVQVLTLLLGNHRSDSWYIKNNTPETLTINLSGQVFQVDFPKEKTEFAVVLSNPVAASDIRITIDSVYSGTEYADTIIAEVGVYGN